MSSSGQGGSPEARRVTGRCLCGAAHYAADGPPINERVCHCRICQKALGAAFNAVMRYPLEAVTVQGPVATYASSPDLVRGFCPTCGTALFSRREAAGVIGLTVGSLDDPDLYRPSLQIWTGSRQRWVGDLDSLPACAGAPPPT